MFGSTLSDEDLIALIQRTGAACVRVVEMPTAERTAPGPKGEASPEQAGTLSAMFCHLAMQEAERRGLEV